MPVSRPLRRLLRVLHAQEEQSRATLEAALAELQRLERAQIAAQERERGGRQLVAASALSAERLEQMIGRLAGIEESLTAARMAAVLTTRAAAARDNVTECREDFLARRIDRRQAESLVHKAEATDAAEATRRGQQSLDDWYLNRQHQQ
ncbi:MAG TPA: hypothetical protein VHX20_07625 [Terracidiphilus sp.]|jgi:hypothetical protein|nr:hypothetical protein [Terracidiphilus sp.]